MPNGQLSAGRAERAAAADDLVQRRSKIQAIVWKRSKIIHEQLFVGTDRGGAPGDQRSTAEDEGLKRERVRPTVERQRAQGLHAFVLERCLERPDLPAYCNQSAIQIGLRRKRLRLAIAIAEHTAALFRDVAGDDG